MKIIPLNKVPIFSLPLPIFSSIHLADAIGKDGEEFSVFVGIEKKQVEQLKKLSFDARDVELQSYTGDKMRFSQGSYEDWYKKNRTPFILIHKQTDALAAIVWFGPKALGKKSIRFGKEEKSTEENDWHTISCRSYRPFRGKGVMGNFTQFVIDLYKQQFPNIKIWAGMDDRNIPIQKLLLGLGFEKEANISDPSANWLVMIKNNSDTIEIWKKF